MQPTTPSTAQSKNILLTSRKALAIYFVIAAFISLCLSLSYIVKHQAFAFVDIGSDLFFNFFPIQIAEVHQLRQLHELTWSFNLGLGGYIGYDFDPLQLLAVFFPDSWQLDIRLPIYLFKLLLGGAFFFGYLRKLGFEPRLSIFGALAFAFSSYEMVNGQWDPNALVAVQFAAYLFFFEAYVRGGGRWHAIAAGLTVGLGFPFDIYTFSLLTVMYSVGRLAFIGKGQTSRYVATLLRFGAWGALGFLIMAPVQLPNLYYLLENPRVSGSHSLQIGLWGQLAQISDPATLGAEMAGLFGKDLLGTGSGYQGWGNYFEAPGFYVGMLLLLCIPQLLGPASTRLEKRLCVVGVALTVLYMVWPAMRLAVYGFGEPAFRLSTLWVSAGLIVLGLAGLRRALVSGPWRIGLLVGGFGLLAILCVIVSVLPQAVNVTQTIKIIGFVSAYTAMLWFFVVPTTRQYTTTILLPIFALELLLFAAPTMIDRVPVNSDGTSQWGSYNDGTAQALALIRDREGDAPFYRIEKTYNSVFFCDALIQNYHGIKSYFFHASSMTRFVDSLHLPRQLSSANYIAAPINRPQILDLLGVKYMLSRGRDLDDVEGYTYVDNMGGVNIYQNNAARGFAQLYDSVVGEHDATSLSDSERDDLLLKSIVLQDPDSVRAELDRLNGSHKPSAGTLAAFATLHMDRDTALSGTVHAPEAEVLLISMPFDPGWSATLDAAKAELFQADYGLTALIVSPSMHQISLHYVPPGRRLGEWLSIGAMLLLIASHFIGRKALAHPAPRRMLADT